MDRIEIKAQLSVDDAGAITGIAWPFGFPDSVGDVIEKGAFNSPSRLPMLFAHDQGQTVGVWDGISEDAKGLQVHGRLLVNDVERAREVRALVREGAVTGLSIGFVTRKSAPRSGGGRTITQLDLHEISIVPCPSHDGARLTSIKEARMSKAIEKKEDEGADVPTIDDRVATLETDVATLKTDVAAIKGSTEETSKALGRIETKMNRPGSTQLVDPKEKAKTELKALSTYLRTGSDVELKAAQSSNDPEGGYFILPTVDTSIRNLLDDVSPMRQIAEVVSINSNTYERFYSVNNRGASWVGETTTRPQDTNRPKLIKHSYGVMEMYAAPAGTRHLFEDASFDVASWFNTWAANDFAVSEGEAFVSGDGVGGKPRGLATYPRVATADDARAWGEMQYLPAGHASAPTDDNWAKALIKLVLTVHPNYRANGAFLMSNATLIRIREIQDSNKRFMFADHGNLSDSPESGHLLGYPVHIDNNMDDIGENKFPIAFGDFKQGYVIVDRHGIRVVRDEVSVKGSILLDTYKRVGGGLGDSRAIKWLKVATS